jgi:hypothetical protein
MWGANVTMIAFVSARLILQHRYDVVEIVDVTLFNILIYYTSDMYTLYF